MLECCLQINLAAKINQQLRESNIQAAIHIHVYATTEGPQGKSTEQFESSCCATQHETKWRAPERRAKKYGVYVNNTIIL